jgi:hypothetical protein
MGTIHLFSGTFIQKKLTNVSSVSAANYSRGGCSMKYDRQIIFLHLSSWSLESGVGWGKIGKKQERNSIIGRSDHGLQ